MGKRSKGKRPSKGQTVTSKKTKRPSAVVMWEDGTENLVFCHQLEAVDGASLPLAVGMSVKHFWRPEKKIYLGCIIELESDDTTRACTQGENDDTTTACTQEEKENDDTTRVCTQEEKENDDTTTACTQEEKENDDTTRVCTQEEKENDDTTTVCTQEEKENDDTTRVCTQEEKENDDTTTACTQGGCLETDLFGEILDVFLGLEEGTSGFLSPLEISTTDYEGLSELTLPESPLIINQIAVEHLDVEAEAQSGFSSSL